MMSQAEMKRDPKLYNEDLAPLPQHKRNWGWFEIFNVWANDVQSLFGYTLAASLFFAYGLSGWAVFAAIILAGIFVMYLVNLSGEASVKCGIPYPVLARASMGIYGANFPAVIRGIVAIFWYGAQTYFASTALAVLISALMGVSPEESKLASQGGLLGMSGIDWFAYILVWIFQIFLFWRGVEWIKKFLNWAGPFVYVVMVLLMLAIWAKVGFWELLGSVNTIFADASSGSDMSAVSGFMAVMGTMIAYFAAVVINFGDFSRFVKSSKEMRKGNFWGLPINMAFFSFIALFVTAGSSVLYGGEGGLTATQLRNPADIVAHIDFLPLTIISALTFFAATVGINLVANFIPPAYDVANLFPSKIDFKIGGVITAVLAFPIGALWVSTISTMGIFSFVNTLGAILAPMYGIMMTDYYITKKGRLKVQELFSSDPSGLYYYEGGWNKKALLAFAGPAMFSTAVVWVPALNEAVGGEGFAWVIGAILGAVCYRVIVGVDETPVPEGESC
ncbi:MAG: NCS1 family nucleobase:cation symporter-1 [Desulfobacter sp.]